jgi:hypothetical protein
MVVVGPAAASAQAPPAATPDAAAVAAAIEQTGWYADAGANPGPDQLTTLATSTSDDSHPIAFAILAAEPAGSSQSFAYFVLDALPVGGRFDTVVVVSPADVGIDSDHWDDGAIDAALDASVDSIRSDPGSGLSQLAAALARQPATTAASGDDGQPDVGFFILLGLGLVALSVVSWLVRGRRGRYQRFTSGSSGWRSSSSSGSHRSSSSSHRSSSGHSHRGSGGRRL